LKKSSVRRKFLQTLSDDEHRLYRDLFALSAHPYQREPEGGWTIWVLLGGRGAGKTRAGSEWVMEKVAEGRAGRVGLVGETLADVRDVMIEGPAGLRKAAMQRDERPRFLKSQRKLVWPNGAQARIFSAEDPDSLRGHAFDLAWCDEFAKWRHAQETFDTLQMAMREGPRPLQMVTTTPRDRPEVRALLALDGVVTTRARSADNRENLSPSFFAAIVKRYAGTRLGRQELDGELLGQAEGALWPRDMLERARVRQAPELARVAVAVDPPSSVGPDADECGIVAAGVDAEGGAYVLEDRSIQGLTPQGWAARALALYAAVKADCIVAEANQGGEMVRAVFGQADPSVPVRLVHATRGKRARAEPVAMLYEQGRVKHVGAFPVLEDQMAAMGVKGGVRSPDRADALVWVLTELMLTRAPAPRVRRA
jgi:phage terminase large subunit-like protein